MPNKMPLRRAYNLKHQTSLAPVAAVRALVIASLGCLCGPAFAQPPNPCARFGSGSVVQDPPALVSQNGTLTVNLAYNTGIDANGLTLYCFTTPEGDESPTLYINPGDTLIVNVKNNLPAPVSANAMKMSTGPADTVCGDPTMDSSSVNIHYHGTNTPPTCHADEVIHTMINSGQTFTYTVPFPDRRAARPVLVPSACPWHFGDGGAGRSVGRDHRQGRAKHSAQSSGTEFARSW